MEMKTLTKPITDLNDKINDNDLFVSIKRGLIQAAAGLLVYGALKMNMVIDEQTALTIAMFVTAFIYKIFRRTVTDAI